MHTTLHALRDEPFMRIYREMPRRIPLSKWNELVACGAENSDVAEALGELDGGVPPTEGDWVVFSPAAAGVLFQTCLAHCQADAFEVRACDFFFADLAAVMGICSVP